MKALAAGRITTEKAATAEELIRYAASIADTVIVGCSNPGEVRANVAAARKAGTMTTEAMRALEARLAPLADRFDTFKG
jgi:hypothetical protein